MFRNVVIKKGVIRTVHDREEVVRILGELQDKFKTDRKIKVVLDETPIIDEMIGYEELMSNGERVEFCSIVDGSFDEFIDLLLTEGGNKKLMNSLSSFIKSKYILYLSIKLDDNKRLGEVSGNKRLGESQIDF